MNSFKGLGYFRSSFNKLNGKLNSASTKLEGGKFSKIFNYFKNIYTDYKTVFYDTIEDAKKQPIKASIYLTGVTSFCYLVHTNPSESQFIDQLVSNTNELLTVGDLIRNKSTDRHMQTIFQHINNGTLKRFTFGVFSVMWVDNYSADVDIYEARCKYMKVGWLDWKDRIIDYGVHGRWRVLDRLMVDYDIDDDEWKDLTVENKKE